MAVYFISPDDVKKNSTFDVNVEDKLLLSNIIDSMEIDLYSILGTKLYEKIYTDVETSSLSGNYKILMDDFITPLLIKTVQLRSLPDIWIKIREKGVLLKEDEGNSSVSIKLLNKLEDKIKSDYSVYQNRLTDYLYYNQRVFFHLLIIFLQSKVFIT